MDTSQLKLKTILPQSQVNQVKTLEKSFIYTVFVEPKGKMVLKAKCRACNYVLNNNNVEKLMHWKRFCIHKYKFKYNHATQPGGKMTVSCLTCNNRFNTISTAFMQQHHSTCNAYHVVVQPSKQQNASASNSNTNVSNDNNQIPSFNTNSNGSIQSTSTQNVEVAHRSTANTVPLNTLAHVVSINLTPKTRVWVNLDELQYNIKKLKRLPANKDIQCAECRICKKFVGIELVLKHRNQCKIGEECQTVDNQEQPSEPEILISVQTVHTESTNEQEDSSSSSDSNANFYARSMPNLPKPLTCFICNTSNGGSFMNLYGTVSSYTSTSINNFIWKWLGGKPSTRNETDTSNLKQEVVCAECLDTINEYDAALVTAKQCKKQLINKLAKTEAHFEKLQKEANGNVKNKTTTSVSMKGNSTNDITLVTDISVSDKS